MHACSSLIHSSSTSLTNPIRVLPSREALASNFQYVQERVHLFWESGSCTYRTCRRDINKPFNQNLQIVDLLLITDHLTAHSQYPHARVVDVHPDNNGMVRNVTVRTANQNK